MPVCNAQGSVASTRPQLHVVADRLPITWSPASGWGRAPGDVAKALESCGRQDPVTWIGSSASLGDDSAVPPKWPGGAMRQVPIDSKLAAAAVNGMANSCLWPALHGMADRVRWHPAWWDAYRVYNERFATVVADTAAQGDLVWVHDYQLLLVAGMLAATRPDLVVGLSVHTPLDASALADLPMAATLIEALEAPALIGVQTHLDQDALSAFCPKRHAARIVSPASVDAVGLAALGADPATGALVERERGRLGTRLLLAGVDRMDHTTGMLKRLDAIDRAFRHGLLRPDDVDIVQIAQPGHALHPTSGDLRLRIERRAHEVASNWLRTDGTAALRLVTEAIDRRHEAALLAAADVALVTPVREGMGLVAKEFSILNEARAGVLVLSTGTGAAERLGGSSVLVDGSDPASIVDGISRAIALGRPERRDMARRRADVVRGWTSEDWAVDFQQRLVGSRVSGEGAGGYRP